MGHPVLDELQRCYSLGSVQSQSFRRWQRIARDEIQPQLDERERLLEENAALKAENADLKTKLAKSLRKPEAIPA